MNHELHNRAFWDADADDYQARHGALLAELPEAWGVWRIPEADVNALGDVAGLDVLEYGCGAAQWSIALAGRGARVVALDQSRAQLAHARRLQVHASVEFPLLCASATAVPAQAASFDLVFCDHGAMSFCDPNVTVAEVGRLLRPGGRLVFCHSSPWIYVTDDPRTERTSRRLHQPYFGMHSFVAPDGTADFAMPTGQWVALFREHGFAIDALHELQAPADATTTYGWNPKWARRWPGEHLWVVRLEPR
ncbi:MAG: class I SAM-dependent methyltransferase [Acidimicrobiia bacterium]